MKMNSQTSIWCAGVLLVGLIGCGEPDEYQAARMRQLTDRYLSSASPEGVSKWTTLNCGDRAPEITGPDIDGQAFRLSDYRGKTVLLYYWANW